MSTGLKVALYLVKITPMPFALAFLPLYKPLKLSFVSTFLVLAVMGIMPVVFISMIFAKVPPVPRLILQLLGISVLSGVIAGALGILLSFGIKKMKQKMDKKKGTLAEEVKSNLLSGRY